MSLHGFSPGAVIFVGNTWRIYWVGSRGGVSGRSGAGGGGVRGRGGFQLDRSF